MRCFQAADAIVDKVQSKCMNVVPDVITALKDLAAGKVAPLPTVQNSFKIVFKATFHVFRVSYFAFQLSCIYNHGIGEAAGASAESSSI